MSNGSSMIALLFLLSVPAHLCCDRDAEIHLLKGQSNALITFDGLAVDQYGNRLPGVVFEFSVDSIPRDWTFETRGKANDRILHQAVSGSDGRFEFDVTAHRLFMVRASIAGYRHLTPEFSDDGNTGFLITASGDLWYKSDPDNPAIYVFVRDGVKEVSALPSRGGFDSGGGTAWRPNKPGWPKKPSLPDVVYKPPTTQPATTPS